MPVITWVICSSKARILRDSFSEGINTYRIKLIRLKDEDADKLLERLAGLPDEKLERSDMIPLLFSPLMDGSSAQPERILKSIRILKRAEKRLSKEDIQKMEAILYILSVKFLDKESLKTIKEEIAMTELGQMIWDDALEQGIKRGFEQGIEQGIAQGIQQGITQGIQQGIAQGIQQGIAQGIQQGIAQGIQQGITQGIVQGRQDGERIGGERYSRLLLRLDEEGRLDQIVRLASDPQYREALYQQYGI